jgi:hypothetical protein
MADKKLINSAVRIDERIPREGEKASGHGSRTFLPGQEEALAKYASKEQLQHLTNQGAISGFGAKAEKDSPADKGEVTIFTREEVEAPAPEVTGTRLGVVNESPITGIDTSRTVSNTITTGSPAAAPAVPAKAESKAEGKK